MLVVVTGLKREARIAAGGRVVTVCGGGQEAGLADKIARVVTEEVQGIVSFGVAGALSPRLRPGDCVLASQVSDGDAVLVSHTPWLRAASTKLPDAEIGTIAGSAAIIASAADKATLYRRTGALAVDMESHVAARAAAARGLPFIAIRTISDAADQALPPAALAAMTAEGGLDGFAIARSVLSNPLQIPALIRTGRDSEKAFAALLRSRSLIGIFLAGLDLG